MHYHPGAFTKNGWSCCKQRHKPTLGCQPTYYLLTRSSSRYAQMRRAQRSQGSPRPYSSPHQRHSTMHNNETSPLPGAQTARSTSCDNLHVIDHSYTHLPEAPIAASCYTLTTVADTPSRPSQPTQHQQEAVSAPLKRKALPVSFQPIDEDQCYWSLDRRSKRHSPRHHQIGPIPQSPLTVVSRQSVDYTNEAIPSPMTKTMLYIGESRCSSTSGDGMFEYDFRSLPRKTSIEPRISNTDPEVIHV